MKCIAGVSLLALAASLPVSAYADSLSSVSFEDGTLGSWLSVGTATIEEEDSLSLGGSLFELVANGDYMLKISPVGSSTLKSQAEILLGLTSGTFDSLGYSGTSKITNMGLVYQEVTLEAGEYTFAWSYAAYDYAPYDDGVFFSVSGNGLNDVSVLAANVTGQADTVIVGSYGSTEWALQTFTITTAGTYILGFGAYNWGDQAVSPILYIDDDLGVLYKDGVAVGVVTTNIDTAEASYDFAGFAAGTLLPTFDGGVLDISGAQSFAEDITVNADGGTFNTLENASLDFSGSLLGTGSVSKSGSGLLVLSGDSSDFTQALGVQEGEVQITGSYGGDIAVGTQASLLIGDGTSFGMIGGAIDNSGEVTFDYDGDSLNYNTLNGAGDYIKSGSGELRLFGSGNASGSLIVEEGNLYVNGDFQDALMYIENGALGGGTGTIGGFVVRTGATAAPGASIGTLTVNGDGLFEVGSSLEVETSADGSADLLQLTGNLVIEGGQVHVLTDGGDYKPLTEYTIITAAGGITGAFEGIDTDLASLTAYLDYDTNSVSVALVRNDYRFGDYTRTTNQYATAQAVQALGYGNDIWYEAMTMDSSQLAQGFDSLSGEIHASVSTSLLENARRIRYAIEKRAAAEPGGKHAWVQYINSGGKDKGTVDAGTAEHAVNGVILGYDMMLADQTVMGVALGHSDTDYDVDGRHSEAKMSTTHLMTYGVHRFGDLRASASLGYDFANIETTRHVVFGSLNDYLTADYDGTVLQAAGEISYDLTVAGHSIAPFLNLAAVDYRISRFGEQGGETALSGTSAKDTREYGTLGVRASDFQLGPAQFDALLGWQYAAGAELKETRHMSFSWYDEPYAIRGVPVAQNSLRLESDMNVAVGQRGNLSLSYGGMFGDKSTDHSVRLEFSLAL